MERCFRQITTLRFNKLALPGSIFKKQHPETRTLHTFSSQNSSGQDYGIVHQDRKCSVLYSHYVPPPRGLCRSIVNKVYRRHSSMDCKSLLVNIFSCDLLYPDCDIRVFKPQILRFHSGISLQTDFTDSSPGHTKPDLNYSADEDSDKEDFHLRPALEAVTPNTEPPHFINIVPGKGPPPEPPVDCCMSGCANCVWIQYCEELKHYYMDGTGQEIGKQAIESIENPGLKMFLKVELGFI